MTHPTPPPGELSPLQALASALSGTIGMGNLAGVAVAIQTGGPGALWWMWVTAIIGMNTKFFTATLALTHRGRDTLGRVRGGPMYVITAALGPRWRPLSLLFCIAGIIGCLPILAVHQLVQLTQDALQWLPPAAQIPGARGRMGTFVVAFLVALLVAGVQAGGLRRVGRVAGALVPWMVALYALLVAWVLLRHAADIPRCLALIWHDAWTGEAVAGGSFAAVLSHGIRRGALSNEAGVGTEMMAHAVAQSPHPVHQGLVAMAGPVVDTLWVCTGTALTILLSGLWRDPALHGVTLTTMAFDEAMPGVGRWLLFACAAAFALSTLFTYHFYGSTCFSYLFGAERESWYGRFYLLCIVGIALLSLEAAVHVIDIAYALMACTTMSITLRLAPVVMQQVRDYRAHHNGNACAPARTAQTCHTSAVQDQSVESHPCPPKKRAP